LNTCIVVNAQGTDTVFKGTDEETVKFLEENSSENPRSVYVCETSDILTESQYLDLAT
jgi:hypothetical protein